MSSFRHFLPRPASRQLFLHPTDNLLMSYTKFIYGTDVATITLKGNFKKGFYE